MNGFGKISSVLIDMLNAENKRLMVLSDEDCDAGDAIALIERGMFDVDYDIQKAAMLNGTELLYALMEINAAFRLLAKVNTTDKDSGPGLVFELLKSLKSMLNYEKSAKADESDEPDEPNKIYKGSNPQVDTYSTFEPELPTEPKGYIIKEGSDRKDLAESIMDDYNNYYDNIDHDEARREFVDCDNCPFVTICPERIDWSGFSSNRNKS